jgi:hypothetical protein
MDVSRLFPTIMMKMMLQQQQQQIMQFSYGDGDDPDSGVPSFMVGAQSGICTALSCIVADPAACPEIVTPTISPTMMTTTTAPVQAPMGQESMQASRSVKYTKAVLTAENEFALMETVVNWAVLGDADLAVPGILATEEGLAPFFLEKRVTRPIRGLTGCLSVGMPSRFVQSCVHNLYISVTAVK